MVVGIAAIVAARTWSERIASRGAAATHIVFRVPDWSLAEPGWLQPASLPPRIGSWAVEPPREAAELPASPPACCDILLPVPTGQFVRAHVAAFINSLLLHNAHHQIRLAIASDPPTLAQVLSVLGERLRAVEAVQPVHLEAHALTFRELRHASLATFLAAELLPQWSRVIAFHPSSLVLDDVAPLWQQLAGEGEVEAEAEAKVEAKVDDERKGSRAAGTASGPASATSDARLPPVVFSSVFSSLLRSTVGVVLIRLDMQRSLTRADPAMYPARVALEAGAGAPLHFGVALLRLRAASHAWWRPLSCVWGYSDVAQVSQSVSRSVSK